MGDFYLGTILAWAGTRVPTDFAWCDGRQLQVQQYPALYAVIGNTYGGNAPTSFALPDLRCRVPMGMANSTPPFGTVQALGTRGGAESVAVSTANLPSHTHAATFAGGSVTLNAALQASSNAGTSSSAQSNYIANPTYPGGADGTGQFTIPPATCNAFVPAAQAGTLQPLAGFSASGTLTGGAVAVANTGNGIPLPTQPMYTVVNYIICIMGMFPSFD